MKLKPTIAVMATGLLALTTLVPCDGAAHAAWCSGCHFRPGKCPTLTNEGSFGFYPTVWQVWPGPLDPSTTYPAAAPLRPATMPPAEPAPLPNASDKLPSKPAAESAPAPVKAKAENVENKSAPVSTYQIIPGH